MNIESELSKIFNDMSWKDLIESNWFLNLKYKYDNYAYLWGHIIRAYKAKLDPEFWTTIKPYWKEIQLALPKGKICPNCGRIMLSVFPVHLKYCANMTRKEYLMELNGWKEFPKCENPTCNNDVNVSSSWKVGRFCSRECKDKISEFSYWTPELTGKSIEECEKHNKWIGKNNILNSWRTWDYDKIKELGINISQEECDNHNKNLHCNTPLNPLRYWNFEELRSLGYEISEEDCISHNLQQTENRKLGGTISSSSPLNPFKYWRYEELSSLGYSITEDECRKHNESMPWNSPIYHLRYWNFEELRSLGYEISEEDCNLHNKQLYETNHKRGLHMVELCSQIHKSGWTSYPEQLLGDILFLLNIHYIREWYIPDKLYRTDYYIPEYNTILECDGMYKFDKQGSTLVLKDFYRRRKQHIESSTGIRVINIPSDDIIFKYRYNKKLLYQLLNKLEYNLVKLSD